MNGVSTSISIRVAAAAKSGVRDGSLSTPCTINRGLRALGGRNLRFTNPRGDSLFRTSATIGPTWEKCPPIQSPPRCNLRALLLLWAQHGETRRKRITVGDWKFRTLPTISSTWEKLRICNLAAFELRRRTFEILHFADYWPNIRKVAKSQSRQTFEIPNYSDY